MDYGFVFPAATHIDEDVKFAEDSGYTHAWLYDSQMLFSDAYVALALCGLKTSTIKLGTGVTNPSSRIAPVTAGAIATVSMLAPGRVIHGIGTGNTSRRTLGMPAARLADLKEHIRVCKDLWQGETTYYQEGERRRQIKFLNPEGGWINIKDPIPTYVAASGPKSLELAAEIGDGVILFGSVGHPLIEYVTKHIRIGAERGGKDPDKIYKVVMTAFHILEPGDDIRSDEVRRAVGPFTTSSSNIFAFSCEDPEMLPVELRDDIMAFKSAYREPEGSIENRHLKLYSDYLQSAKDEHEHLITEKMLKATTLVGTREEIKESIERMQAAGIDQVAIQPTYDPSGDIKKFAEQIING